MSQNVSPYRQVAEEVSQQVFAMAEEIRYVAVYYQGKLESVSTPTLSGSEWWESDKYEELIVNPTLITLLRQRGNINRGGIRRVMIEYGDLMQFVQPIQGGHISVGFEPGSDYARLLPKITRLLKQRKLIIATPGKSLL